MVGAGRVSHYKDTIMHKAPALQKVPMLVIAFTQGILLYLLYRAFDNNTWPSESPLWSYPLLTLAIVVPSESADLAEVLPHAKTVVLDDGMVPLEFAATAFADAVLSAWRQA